MRRSVVLLCLSAIAALAGSVSTDISTSPADLRFSRFEGYDVVELNRGYPVPQPGEPSLPHLSATVVIPANARVTGVRITPLESRDLPGTYDLVPSQPARPISRTEPVAFVAPDPAVYSSRTPYPAGLLAGWSAGTAAGFRLTSVDLTPLQYVPAEHRLVLHTRLRVTVDFTQDAGFSLRPTARQQERMAQSLRLLVANPGDLAQYAPPSGQTDQFECDYLVITSEQLAAGFEPFAAYRTARGLRTKVVTSEWISRNLPGRDLPEKTRNLIIDWFRNRGLSYVLLAGDNELVPSRRVRVWVGETRGDIPTDLYFGDLDYSWDSDNNGIFGEVGRDSVDLYADVFVGRASVDNADEVANFIAKVRSYEADPATDYIKRSLLPAGWLWYPDYHGRLVNDSIAAITPAGWHDVELENSPPAAVVADSFDHGFAVFDPAGHGNENGVYDQNGTPIYTSSSASRQTNDRRFSIMTSLACDPGNFEAEDCLAEEAMNCAGGGCIGVMMNSRYGWGTPPEMGPSELVCVRFYDFFFNRDEVLLGPCHDRSREHYAAVALYDDLWRWCTVQFNLLGDPALDIWSEPPAATELSCPDSIASGSQTLVVTVDSDGHPVTNALVCAFRDQDVFATARTNASGRASLAIHPVNPGELLVTATGHDLLPSGRSITVTTGAPEPLLTFHRARVDDPGQRHENGVLEPGETGTLTLVLANSGTGPAASVSTVLRPVSAGVTVTDSLADYGDVAPADTAAADFVLAAAPDVLPGSSAELLAEVTSEGRTWEFVFLVDLGYPGRVTAEVDTGTCALTVTARGGIGFDYDSGTAGRGFRFPETDTSCLKVASFCVGNSADYFVDRFHAFAPYEYDEDWLMADSIYLRAPVWNGQQVFVSSFTDRGHPAARELRVQQHAVGVADASFVVLVYDVINDGSEPAVDLYGGILADFDVCATDRLHDLAYTTPGLHTAYMRNVNIADRFVGVVRLDPEGATHLGCIDHERYVYPDSGLSESMKLRALQGQLGDSCSDRPFNWSVAVSTGPFDLDASGGRRRVAFGFVAAADSAAYLAACGTCRQWYSDNVAVSEPARLSGPAGLPFAVRPNPLSSGAVIRFSRALPGPVTLQVFSAAGRLVDEVRTGPKAPGESVTWTPRSLAAGVYLLRLEAAGEQHFTRVTVVR